MTSTMGNAQRERLMPVCMLAAGAFWALQLAAGQVWASSALGVLEPRPGSSERFAETFTVISDLSDGTYVQVQVFVSNAGWGDGNAACRVLVTSPGRPPWTQSARVGKGDWQWHKGPPERLRVGSCVLEGSNDLNVDARVGQARIQLALSGKPVRNAPPHQSLAGSKGFYRAHVLVYWAPIQATLRIPGSAERRVAGFGYADHSRSNLLPKEMARQWFRFRGLKSKQPWVLLARFPPGDVPAEGWVWNHTSNRPMKLERFVLKKSPTGWSASFRANGQDLRLHTRETLFRYAPLEEYGFLGSVLGAWIGNPVTHTFRAVLDGNQMTQVLEGIVEETHDEE